MSFKNQFTGVGSSRRIGTLDLQYFPSASNPSISLISRGIAMLKEFQIVGRKLATSSQQGTEEPLYKMRIFARDAVVAKSRFFYFLQKLKKVKKSNGEIVSINEVHEKKPMKVKNFGVWIRYDSRSGTHNMYKEYRAMSRVEAIASCCIYS